jgi:hypothetical protein
LSVQGPSCEARKIRGTDGDDQRQRCGATSPTGIEIVNKRARTIYPCAIDRETAGARAVGTLP